MVDPGAWQEIIVTAIATAGAIFGGQKGVKAIWGSTEERQNKKIISDVSDLITRKEWHKELEQYMTRIEHERECNWKIPPLTKRLDEIHSDVKGMPKMIFDMIKKNGGA